MLSNVDHLVLATHNRHKVSEFRSLLGDRFQIRDLSGVQITPVEETGKTFAENAALKAVAVSKQVAGMVMADDSGLEVEALSGAPGVFSARYAGAMANDRNNVEKLLGAMQGVGNRRARFRCVIVLAQNGRPVQSFEGMVEGSIVDQPRGKNGFGYDPVFIPNGYAETFAEMTAEMKNRISHRAKAAAALAGYLKRVEF